LLRLPISPLFPYTTLFRSRRGLKFFAVATAFVLMLQIAIGAAAAITDAAAANGLHVAIATLVWSGVLTTALLALPRADRASESRSEEHTSELQSRVDLVCR